jgi:hypothetical protein
VRDDRAVTAEVQALERLDLQGLREQWRRRFGPPPGLRSPELLGLMLAWRIQAGAFGDLDGAARRRLRRQTALPATLELGAGSKLAREWKGERIEVEIVDGGFVHAGRTYRSLSEIARAVTGVRWNGPRFFGLREGSA